MPWWGWVLIAIPAYLVIGGVLWAITGREEMLVFWLPVFIVGVRMALSWCAKRVMGRRA